MTRPPLRVNPRVVARARADILETLRTWREGLCNVDLWICTRLPWALIKAVLVDLVRSRKVVRGERNGRVVWKAA